MAAARVATLSLRQREFLDAPAVEATADSGGGPIWPTTAPADAP